MPPCQLALGDDPLFRFDVPSIRLVGGAHTLAQPEAGEAPRQLVLVQQLLIAARDHRVGGFGVAGFDPWVE